MARKQLGVAPSLSTHSQSYASALTLWAGRTPLVATAVKTADYTANANEVVVCNDTSAHFTVTFPAAPPDRTVIGLVKINSGGNYISVVAGGSDAFNGSVPNNFRHVSDVNGMILAVYSTSAASWYLLSDCTPTATLDFRYAPFSPRATTIASAATHTITVGSTDIYTVTAQAAAATFGAPSGTGSSGQRLTVRIKDNGTARALTWNAAFASSGIATLPTTTVANKTHHVEFIYDEVAAKWIALRSDTSGY